MSFMELGEFKAFDEKVVVGNTIINNSLWSTSKEQNIAVQFRDQFEAKAKGTVLLHINGRTGVDLTKLTGYYEPGDKEHIGSEEEVIFNKGRNMKVTKVVRSTARAFDGRNYPTIEVWADEVVAKNLQKGVEEAKSLDLTKSIPPHIDKALLHWTNISTDQGYKDVRQYLETGKTLQAQTPKTVEALREIFASSTPRYDGTTYRGVCFTDADKFKLFIDRLQVGGEYVDKGFMATAKTEVMAKIFVGRAEPGRVLFIVEGKSGVELDKYNTYEVLFNLETKFKVKSKAFHEEGVWHITLEELPA
jgi:hypothetical protein